MTGMETVGIHSKPLSGVVMNGHTPPQDNPERSRTTADERERRRADGASFIVVALLNAAIVAVVAFSGSWQHQYELSIQLGQAHWVAGMQPLSVEGLIAAATLVIWYAGRHGYPRRDAWAAYVVLAAGVGQTVLMNLGADYRSTWPWLGPEISVWPAVAFVAAYEMAVWLVRKRQDAAPLHDSSRDKTGDKPQAKQVARKRAPAMTKQAAAAAVIRDNPGLTNEELAVLAGCKVRTIQRARNGTAKT